MLAGSGTQPAESPTAPAGRTQDPACLLRARYSLGRGEFYWRPRASSRPCVEGDGKGDGFLGQLVIKNQLPRMPHSPRGQRSPPRSGGLSGGCFGAGLPPSAIGVVERAQLGMDSCPLNPARPQVHLLPGQLLLGCLQGRLQSPLLDQETH